MFKKILILAIFIQASLALGGDLYAGGGISMIRGDEQVQYQTQIIDGAVEWQGPEVTVRVIDNDVVVIKNGATIKITNGLVEVAGADSLQVRKVELDRATQEMGGGISMINAQPVQGALDTHSAPVSATAVTPSTQNLNTGFTGKFFRKFGIE